MISSVIRAAGVVFCVLLAMAVGAPAEAATYTFRGITGNSATNTATGERQLTMEVTEAESIRVAGRTYNQVNFTFRNSGPGASSITDVYFDDGTLMGISQITDSGAGVSFAQGASPGSLPGGSSIRPGFETSVVYGQSLSADSNSPTQPMGVNPGEWLRITVALINNKTFTDTLSMLERGLGLRPGDSPYDTLRVGIHVQGFANGGSESFINGPSLGGNPPGEAVPLPGVVWGGVALLGGTLLRRRRMTSSRA